MNTAARATASASVKSVKIFSFEFSMGMGNASKKTRRSYETATRSLKRGHRTVWTDEKGFVYRLYKS